MKPQHPPLPRFDVTPVAPHFLSPAAILWQTTKRVADVGSRFRVRDRQEVYVYIPVMSADSSRASGATARSGASVVLLTLASAQFLMTLDTSVMNVSIATVAKDVGTTVTGIQTAITMYTLVMAAFMITGGKIGQIIGRKRAFAIGSVIYGCGSLTTALSPSLPVLLLGWSLLEGLGAVLILPAIVALVATNFDREARPRAYGLVASAGAIAVAAGPLIGGLFTTYASWRWVFAGEVLIVIVILLLTRRVADTPIWSVRHCRHSASVCSCTACCAPVPGGLSSRSPTRRNGWACRR
jgi:MFS family permease